MQSTICLSSTTSRLSFRASSWQARSLRSAAGRLFVFNFIEKLPEQIVGVVRSGRRFGMVLHREGRPVGMPQYFDRAVVEIQVGDADIGRQRIGIDREPVILGGDLH